TGAAQHIGASETARPGADNPDGFAALDLGRSGLYPALFPCGIGDVFLNSADGDGAVARLLNDAVALAKPVLRANSTADLGEGIGFLRALPRFADAPLSGQAQPVGDVVLQWAVGLAVRDATLTATTGLLGRFMSRKLAVDLVEVLRALLGASLIGHLSRERDEPQHFLHALCTSRIACAHPRDGQGTNLHDQAAAKKKKILPFSETLFRTCKYRPDWPTKGFATKAEAQAWVKSFVSWYNDEHLHSAIRFVTPNARHAGHDGATLASRATLYANARAQNPERWSGKTRREIVRCVKR